MKGDSVGMGYQNPASQGEPTHSFCSHLTHNPNTYPEHSGYFWISTCCILELQHKFCNLKLDYPECSVNLQYPEGKFLLFEPLQSCISGCLCAFLWPLLGLQPHMLADVYLWCPLPAQHESSCVVMLPGNWPAVGSSLWLGGKLKVPARCGAHRHGGLSVVGVVAVDPLGRAGAEKEIWVSTMFD